MLRFLSPIGAVLLLLHLDRDWPQQNPFFSQRPAEQKSGDVQNTNPGLGGFFKIFFNKIEIKIQADISVTEST